MKSPYKISWSHQFKKDYRLAMRRQCHIAPDWLLIYQIHENILILELTRTGSHSDLF